MISNDRTFPAARVVALGTATSKALGMARSILMASFFGTSLAQSVFVLAFKVPNLFRRLFGEGALSAAFIPVFAETLETRGKEEADRLAGRMGSLLAATLAMLAGGGMLVLLAIRFGAAPGDKAALFLSLLTIMLPYLFFICLFAFCMALLNTFRHFAMPAFSPVLLNIVWIAVLLWVCPRFGDAPEERIFGVAWGVLAAGALQLLAQLPVLAKIGLRLPVKFTLRDRQVQAVLRAMGPAALGMGVFQINVLVDGFLALWVAEWAPAALDFAVILVYLPLGVFGTALGTVLLPVFSRQAVSNERDRIRHTLGHSLAGLFAVLIPAAVGLMVLARPIVQLVYEWPGRQFDSASTLQTARALLFYAPGLLVFGAYKALVPAFYAFKDTRTPVRVGMAAAGLNFVLNVFFILTWPADFRHAGLACATVLASVANCAVLLWLLQRGIGSLDWRAFARTALVSCLAAALMALAAAGTHASLEAWSVGGEGAALKARQAIAVGAAIAAGALTYGGLLLVWRRKILLANAGANKP